MFRFDEWAIASFCLQYLVFVLLNLALVIVGGMTVLRFSQKPRYVLKEHISYYHLNTTSKNHVDKIRNKLNCCGINAFRNLTDLKAEIRTVTSSCCIPQHEKACLDMLNTLEFQKWEEIRQTIYTEVSFFLKSNRCLLLLSFLFV